MRHTYRPPEILHERFRLLHLGRVYLAAYDGTERHLGPQFLADRERKCRLAGSWSSGEQNSPTGHLLRLHEIDDESASLQTGQYQRKLANVSSKTCLSSCGLANEASARRVCASIACL